MSSLHKSRIIRVLRSVGICAVLLSLCSCVTMPPECPVLPAPVSFNSGAGRGDWIKIKLGLENGKELPPMILDTGNPHTIFDKSLEPLLGKRLGTGSCYQPFLGGFVKVDVYPAPKLFLGGVELLTGSTVYAYDFQKKEPGVEGILGMDCLRHYCLQFDFSRNEMRFLDPDAPSRADLGQAMPLTIIGGLVIARADCFGTGKIFFCPDTGCQLCDATLKPAMLRRLAKEHHSLWSTTFAAINHDPKMVDGISQGVFAGETYSDLTLMEWYGSWPDGELLGLPFFARNLTTFDFPKRMMYLKKENSEPLDPRVFVEEEAGSRLCALCKEGKLPGIATNEAAEGDSADATTCFTNYPISLTFNLHKDRVPGWVDVTAKVRSLAAGSARSITVNSKLAGWDPAPNRPKKLEIVLRVKKRQKTVEGLEGKSLALPAKADIVRACYGDLTGLQTGREPSETYDLIYHYTMIQEVHDGPWTLKEAWLTDKKGHRVKRYAVLPGG